MRVSATFRIGSSFFQKHDYVEARARQRWCSPAVITEFIFSYPGLGQLTITAISQNDYPTIYATAMLVGIFVILGNLIAGLILVPRMSSSAMLSALSSLASGGT